MRAAVILKRTNRNFWFFFLTLIPDRFANLNNAPAFKKVGICSGSQPFVVEGSAFIFKNDLDDRRIYILSGVAAIAGYYRTLLILRYRYYFYGNKVKYLFGYYPLAFFAVAGVETS